MRRLDRDFFIRPTLEVSKDLIGKVLMFKEIPSVIVETEAYVGSEDAACHAAKGMTKRNEAMFKIGGYTYVYFIYGMYYCLNIVTEYEGFPAAVLIRGVKLLNQAPVKLNGPGKLCKYLGIDLVYNKIDTISSKEIFVNDVGIKFEFKATPRIGISKAKDHLWRFVALNEYL